MVNLANGAKSAVQQPPVLREPVFSTVEHDLLVAMHRSVYILEGGVGRPSLGGLLTRVSVAFTLAGKSGFAAQGASKVNMRAKPSPRYLRLYNAAKCSACRETYKSACRWRGPRDRLDGNSVLRP